MQKSDINAMGFNWLREKIDNLEERIHRLAKWQAVAIDKNLQDVSRIRKIEEELNSQQELIWQHDISIGNHDECLQRITEDDMKAEKQPHKCPVCSGHGKIGYPEVLQDKCHSCSGKGIVWG